MRVVFTLQEWMISPGKGEKGVRVSLEKLAFRDQSKEEESGKSDEKEELKR